MRTPYDSTKSSAATDWRFRAACVTTNPEEFFPVGDTKDALAQAQRAKRICASCPVQTACLDWATTTGIAYGVFGGATEDERRSAKRRQDRHARHAHEQEWLSHP